MSTLDIHGFSFWYFLVKLLSELGMLTLRAIFLVMRSRWWLVKKMGKRDRAARRVHIAIIDIQGTLLTAQNWSSCFHLPLRSMPRIPSSTPPKLITANSTLVYTQATSMCSSHNAEVMLGIVMVSGVQNAYADGTKLAALLVPHCCKNVNYWQLTYIGMDRSFRGFYFWLAVQVIVLRTVPSA